MFQCVEFILNWGRGWTSPANLSSFAQLGLAVTLTLNCAAIDTNPYHSPERHPSLRNVQLIVCMCVGGWLGKGGCLSSR